MPAHLRLITRHALLTYAHKHWPSWQVRVLAGIIRVEAWLSQRRAWQHGDDVHAGLFDSLGRMVSDFARVGSATPADGCCAWCDGGRNGVQPSLSIVIPSRFHVDTEPQ